MSQKSSFTNFQLMQKNEKQSTVPVLELNNATVQRNAKAILNQLSLTINMGQHTAIVGPNGSGKSTLIKLIAHKIYPMAHNDGSIPVRMFGQAHWIVEKLRSRLGIVSSDLQHQFKNYAKKKNLTGLEVVVSNFFASVRLFSHQHATEEMYDNALLALKKLQAGYLADKRLAVMSTGEVRRVLIARALVHEPELLVLDEPTTALDFVARHHFMEQIRRIVQQDTTLVLVTHHLEEIIPEIERVVLLREGEAYFDGSKKDALTTEKLSQAFGQPVALSKRNGHYNGSVALG